MLLGQWSADATTPINMPVQAVWDVCSCVGVHGQSLYFENALLRLHPPVSSVQRFWRATTSQSASAVSVH
jgi:hypothetical protein